MCQSSKSDQNYDHNWYYGKFVLDATLCDMAFKTIYLFSSERYNLLLYKNVIEIKLPCTPSLYVFIPSLYYEWGTASASVLLIALA